MEYIISDPEFLACSDFAFEKAEASIVGSLVGGGQIEVEVSMQEDMLLIAAESSPGSQEFHCIGIMNVNGGPRIAGKEELDSLGVRGFSIAK